MSETPIDPIDPADDALNTALVAFTGCIGESMDDICSYGLTIGDSYVPFDADPEDDCEDDEILCSQVWVRVTGVQPTEATGSWDNGDCGAVLSIGLEVGVLRCYDLPNDGDAPTASETLAAATQAMSDMQTIYFSAMSCDVWDKITSGSWQPRGPLGGQYGGTWTFTVEL